MVEYKEQSNLVHVNIQDGSKKVDLIKTEKTRKVGLVHSPVTQVPTEWHSMTSNKAAIVYIQTKNNLDDGKYGSSTD